MSWQSYIDDHLMAEIEGNHLTAAAILGHDGSVWAQSTTFPQAGIGEASIAREVFSAPGTCDEHQMPPPHVTHEAQQHQIATTAFHISRPSLSISTIISPPPLHHHASIILDEDSFHVHRMILQNQNFQQQHHKLERSASGLEEVIMGCTSTDHVKEQESSVTNPQEAEWLKYSTFWHDPDNPDHHR